VVVNGCQSTATATGAKGGQMITEKPQLRLLRFYNNIPVLVPSPSVIFLSCGLLTLLLELADFLYAV
jgi:hypothetical protein